MYKQYHLIIEGNHFHADLCRIAFIQEELVEFYADAQNPHCMHLYHPDQYSHQDLDATYDAVFLKFLRKNIQMIQQSQADKIIFMVDIYMQENGDFELFTPEIYLFLGQQGIQVKVSVHLQDE